MLIQELKDSDELQIRLFPVVNESYWSLKSELKKKNQTVETFRNQSPWSSF